MLIDGNNFISYYLKNDKLFAAGKIGVTELKILYTYYFNNKTPEVSIFQEGYVQSGIFPLTEETYHYFCETYIESIKCLDLAPRWCGVFSEFERDLYNKLAPNCYDTRLPDLEPQFFDKPWINSLENKTVLVISPFTESIEKQYKRFDKVWDGKFNNNFNLKTYKFPLSRGLCSYDNQYKSYKECLEHTQQVISNIEFDFCVLGVGAYSLPLCNFIKMTMGKSALHLGGATQILFGIKGRRWDGNSKFEQFFNDYWIRPQDKETPVYADNMEGRCYW